MDAGIEHRRKTWKVLLFLWLLLAAVNIGVGAWFGFDARTLSPVAVALGSACLAVSSIQHSKLQARRLPDLDGMCMGRYSSGCGAAHPERRRELTPRWAPC